MEKCLVSSTRRDVNPTFPSLASPRVQEAGLDLSVEPSGDTTIVRVKTTKLTYPVLSAFFDEVRATLEDGHRHLILDLEAVTYIDSATIGCLVEIHRLVADLGGALRLSGLRPRVHGMLSMTGVDRFLEVYGDEAKALASFARSSS
jgi:anti-sigma B factor antagonist